MFCFSVQEAHFNPHFHVEVFHFMELRVTRHYIAQGKSPWCSCRPSSQGKQSSAPTTWSVSLPFPEDLPYWFCVEHKLRSILLVYFSLTPYHDAGVWVQTQAQADTAAGTCRHAHTCRLQPLTSVHPQVRPARSSVCTEGPSVLPNSFQQPPLLPPWASDQCPSAREASPRLAGRLPSSPGPVERSVCRGTSVQWEPE